MNILLNAAQAIDKEGMIGVTTSVSGEMLKIAIRDNGAGISEKIRTKIFGPFFTTKEVGKGTGLGMSISFDIIKKHDGEIRFESEVGVGTTFTLIFPQTGVKEKDGAP